jgi:4-amino-4-deoxy-L-arabinose transferase-like glycosyltransferase
LPDAPRVKPQHLLSIFVIVQALVLGLVPALVSSAPTLDVAESLSWGQHWLIGTHKHPPMPAWLLALFQYVFPSPIAGPFVLSQLAVATTYWLAYRTARQFFNEIEAAAATLLLAGSIYMTAASIEFNHNVLQLPFWAAAVLFYVKLRKEPHNVRSWLGLGLICGAGLYVKYSYLLLLLILLVMALADRTMRRCFRSPYPYLAAAVALVLLLPHLVWVAHSDYAPLQYAAMRSASVHPLLPVAGRFQPLVFLGEQFIYNMGVLAIPVVARIGLLNSASGPAIDEGDRRLIRVVTFAPVLATTAMFLAAGRGANGMWATPMFTTLGLWVVAEFPRCWTMRDVWKLFIIGLAIVAIAGAALAIDVQYLLRGIIEPRMWPMREIAGKADGFWHAQSGKPLRIVGGDPWLADLVSAGDTERPFVLIENSFGLSPWLSPSDLRREGAVFLSYDPQSPITVCKPFAPYQRMAISDPRVPPIFISMCLPEG